MGIHMFIKNIMQFTTVNFMDLTIAIMNKKYENRINEFDMYKCIT